MKSITIISWNVNGLRAALKKGFMDFLKEYDPDILCLQETKAERGQVTLDLPQYEEYWNSAERRGYSGTAIFTKEKPKSVLNGFANGIAEQFGLTADSYGDPMKEGRIITAEFETFFVVTVYTPNSKPDLGRLALRQRQWDPAFLAHCKWLEEKSAKGGSASGGKKPVIFCGDLNVAHTEDDLARPKDNDGTHGFTKEERTGFQSFLDAGFVDTFRMFTPGPGHYTWWTPWANARKRNVGWRIDYVLVSQSLKKNVKSAFILPHVMGSDHCPVGITLSI
jgi:exodeoxyribonuclease-3